MPVRIKPRTRSFEVDIELQEVRQERGDTKVILYIKSPNKQEHHRVIATVLNGTDLPDLARDLEMVLEDLPEWNHDRNISCVLQFIRDNPDRITSP